MSQYQTILLQTEVEVDLESLHSYLDTKLPLAKNNPDIFVLKKDKNSIGIGEVQQLISWSYKRPFQHEDKLGIVKDADSLTIEAQNSLLKTLEEPPLHTQLVLITANIDSILPTIRSRSRIIETGNFKQESSQEWRKLASQFLTNSYIERNKIIANITKSKQKRVEVNHFLEALLRELLSKKYQVNNYQEVLILLRNSLLASKQGVNLKPLLVNINITLGNKPLTS